MICRKKYVVVIWQYRFFEDTTAEIKNEFALKRNAIKDFDEWCKDTSVMSCTLFKRLRSGNIKILRCYP